MVVAGRVVLAGFIALGACAPKVESPREPALEFEVIVDPVAGTFSVVAVSGRGLVRAHVVQDGVTGVGPPNSVEMVTANVASDPTGTGRCGFASSFCADVTVRSFYGVPLSNVHVVLESVVPAAGHAVLNSDQYPGLSSLFGLWAYASPIAPGAAATRQWIFQDDGAPFRIVGRVYCDIGSVAADAGVAPADAGTAPDASAPPPGPDAGPAPDSGAWVYAPETMVLQPHPGPQRQFGRMVAASGNAFITTPIGQLDRPVYVMRYGGSWAMEATLRGSDVTTTSAFGWSIALDGDTAIVGDYQDGTRAAAAGAAYVFVRSGGTWTQQAKLLASDGSDSDCFGAAVSLDGDTALIGTGCTGNRRAYVFTRSGTTWTQQQRLDPLDNVGSRNYGSAVAVSGDVAVVGAPELTNVASGRVYVFRRVGSVWSPVARLVATPAVASRFGYSVAVDETSGIIVVGDPYANTTAPGSVYVFARSGSTWVQQARLEASDPGSTNNYLGFRVAAAPNHAVAGALYADGGRGAVYSFTRTGTVWSERKLSVATGGADQLGDSVAIGDGFIVSGAPQRDDNGANSGAAFVFGL